MFLVLRNKTGFTWLDSCDTKGPRYRGSIAGHAFSLAPMLKKLKISQPKKYYAGCLLYTYIKISVFIHNQVDLLLTPLMFTRYFMSDRCQLCGKYLDHFHSLFSFDPNLSSYLLSYPRKH